MMIKKANADQYHSVRAFYHSLIDGIADRPYSAGWKKDIYPAPDYLLNAIRNGELYIALENHEIIASMVLNHECNEGYHKYQWLTKAEQDEISVIHALGVHPLHTGKGYAKKMVKFAIETAQKNHQKAIRLDVLKGNVPAEKLYAGLGFQHLHTLPMFYDDTGWTDYELYEYKL
ncbi:MAG: GNAT family N-acetyltransferase [Mailhella sp.]|nr:GNAT family N-acetyltransferase [Mailhella sp.]